MASAESGRGIPLLHVLTYGKLPIASHRVLWLGTAGVRTRRYLACPASLLVKPAPRASAEAFHGRV
jgi:hypothetical protein